MNQQTTRRRPMRSSDQHAPSTPSFVIFMFPALSCRIKSRLFTARLPPDNICRIATSRSAGKSHRPSRFPASSSPPLSLDHFLLRQRAIALYRTIMRGCYKLPDPVARAEMREYARAEFERHRQETDLRTIRYFLSTGKADFDRLGKMVSGGR